MSFSLKRSSRLLAWICAVLLITGTAALGEETPDTGTELTPREQMIEGILNAAHEQFEKTGGKPGDTWGKPRRAQKKGDIYICKNFTVYCFRQAAPGFRMAEYPDVPLIIPDNLPPEECTTYAYGYKWEDVGPEKGNPFYEAAVFRYNNDLSKDENRELAREFLQQAQRGDFFQMRANYYWGIGAHSMIFTGDYDPDTDTVTWCDSNMRGYSKSGVRYGYVQWNANEKIDWFVDAFCRKKHGATIYRLRDDIITKQE